MGRYGEIWAAYVLSTPTSGREDGFVQASSETRVMTTERRTVKTRGSTSEDSGVRVKTAECEDSGVRVSRALVGAQEPVFRF